MIHVKIKAAVLALPVMMVGVSPSLYALQGGGKVDLGLLYTDNATLASTDEVEDIISRFKVTGVLSETSGPLTGDAKVVVRRLDYLDDSFDSQTYLEIDSGAIWQQIPNRLVWQMNDHYEQALLNNLNGVTPSNVEDINAFRLSALATFPLANRHALTISPTFSDFYHELSDNDNQQLGLDVGWAYRLAPTVSVSLNGSFTDVNYDSNAISDNEKKGLDIAMSVTRARSRYNASIGFTKVEKDTGAETDGVTGSFNWDHDFTGRSNIVVHVSSQITDTSNIFLNSAIDPNTGSFVNVQNSADTVTDDVIRVTYSRKGNEIDSTLWTELRRLDYDTSLQDRDVQEIGGDVSFKITPLVKGSVNGRFTRTEEDISSSTDKRYFLEGKLDYSFSRKLTGSAGLRLQKQESSNIPTREYDALGVFANFGYKLGR